MAHKLIPLTLEQHQQVLYEILYMVDDFCKAHDIAYFLVGGSLLGAVRHQGIIPWDDDVDIAMTRNHYQKFLTEFHSAPPNGYSLYDIEHDKTFCYPFAKVAKNNTFLQEPDGPKINRICIDIFVYDGLGNDFDLAKEHFCSVRNKIAHTCKLFYSDFNRTYDCLKSKLVYFFTIFPVKHIPFLMYSYFTAIYNKALLFNVEDSKYSACIVWGVYGIGEIQPSESFLKLSTSRFGTRNLPIPSGWNDYLFGIYGDYMTPIVDTNAHKHSVSGSYLIEKIS